MKESTDGEVLVTYPPSIAYSFQSLARTSHEHFVKTVKPFIKAVSYRGDIVIEIMTKCSPEVNPGGASLHSVLAVNIVNLFRRKL